jgi:hypothetical protein
VTSFLEAKHDEIVERIHELEPLVAEFHRLEAAAAALAALPGVATGSDQRDASPRPPRKRRTQVATTTPRRPGRPRGSGKRALQVIELVTAQPGITIPNLALQMGIEQNYLYRVVPRLADEKKLVRRGKGWYLRER